MSEAAASAWVATPQPDYVLRVFTTPVDGEAGTHTVCAIVFEEVIWQPGDEDSDVRSAFRASARILINGNQVPQLKFIAPEMVGIVRRYDESGKSLGSYSGPDGACFDASNLALGSYIATLQFTSTSGVGYSYSWLLSVPGTDEAMPKSPQ